MIIYKPVQGPNLVITVPADALEAKRSIGTKTQRNTNQSELHAFLGILGRELGPCGVSLNQRSRWKHASSPLKHV